MQESHSEGVANHTDAESCGEAREGLAEALTGESTRRAIEPRKYIQLRDADTLSLRGRQHRKYRNREVWKGPARSKTLARTDPNLSPLSFPPRARYYLRQEPDEAILQVRICAGGAEQSASLPRPG